MILPFCLEDYLIDEFHNVLLSHEVKISKTYTSWSSEFAEYQRHTLG